MPSNQGSEMIDQVLAEVPSYVQSEMARILWREVRAHPGNSACTCISIEALCYLYDQGYRLVKE